MTRSNFEEEQSLSLFLDPVRQAPDGAITCRAVTEAIAWLKSGRVEHMDVASAMGIYEAADAPNLFHLALVLRDLVRAGTIPPPFYEVHGGTIDEALFSRKLLEAALGPPDRASPTTDWPTAPSTPRPLASLDADEIARLLRLNAVLFEVERWILERSREMILNWGAMECVTGDDLEIEPVICYCLRTDDPRYRDEDDNFVAVSTFGSIVTGLRKRWEGGRIACVFDEPVIAALDTEDWDHGPRNAFHRLGEIRHSRLFHDLYDHQHLTWDDMLSIGSIWVRLRCEHQHDFVIDPAF